MTVFAGQVPTGDQAVAWAAAQATFDRFAAADHYLFSVPMWNHGVPYILKQFIDVVSQPGLIFAFDPEPRPDPSSRRRQGLLTIRAATIGR